MSAYLTAELRAQLLRVDDHRCAYCLTTEANSGQPMTVDHILPETHCGLTEFGNLCFCCRRCNEFKGSKIAAIDPLTGEVVPFFHPRRQKWSEHFEWDETGALMIGLSATGRATVPGLNMNDPVIVATRRRWVSVGWHPPLAP